MLAAARPSESTARLSLLRGLAGNRERHPDLRVERHLQSV
jgi:hypothetical protein